MLPENDAISPALKEGLQTHFGFDSFRPGQQEVIERLLAGDAVLAMLPTGGGKSICFQLPALLLEGITLVVSPLIALMKDQVDRLTSRGIPALRLDSSLTEEEMQQAWLDLESGRVRLLYLSPERLAIPHFVRDLSRLPLAMLAVDEAHCLSEWGHNFRPDYLRLPGIARKLKLRRVLALTATATPRVVTDICREFRIRKRDVVKTSFHRPRLSLHISPVSADHRQEILLSRLTPDRFPAIVYVTRQETAESVASWLGRSGIKARPYHAGLADEVRQEIQEAFMAGSTDVVVATIAFGMGIDKSDIRAVFHYNLPRTLENYQQEVGRAGRDGGDAWCEMLACGDDLSVLRNFVFGDTPDASSLRLVADHFFRQGREFDINRYELSRSLDIKPTVLDTIIAYLERQGLLQPLDSFASRCQIAFQDSEERALAGYPAPRRRQLSRIFDSGQRGWRWIRLDLQASGEALSLSPARIMDLLQPLAEAGDIRLKLAGIRHRFRVLGGESVRPPEVAIRLKEMFHGRESLELDRLEQVVALAEGRSCITRRLLAYFGEKLKGDCGHCSRCLTKSRPGPLPSSGVLEISTEDREAILQLGKQRLPALQSPRQMARFLCGLSSPATLRDRLTRHEAFGLLKAVPFEEVLALSQR